MGIVQMCTQLSPNCIYFPPRLAIRLFGHLLIGKVDRGFCPGRSPDQARAPAVIERGQPPTILFQRLAPLGLGFRIDQVNQRFGARQVEFAVFDSAPGEFARLGRSEARHRIQRAQHSFDNRAAAMDMEFGDVLAGEAGRLRKPQHQCLIERFAGAVAQPRQNRLPCCNLVPPRQRAPAPHRPADRRHAAPPRPRGRARSTAHRWCHARP